MQSRLGLICSFGAASVMLGAVQTTEAGAVSPVPELEQRFVMRDHTFGAARPPVYSLRVDGMAGGRDIVTFSSEVNGAQTFIDVLRDTQTQQTVIHIHGTLYGGVDTGLGDTWAPPSDSPTDAGYYTGLYEVDFTYSMGIEDRANGWVVNNGDDANFSNNGVLRFLDGSRGGITTLSDGPSLVDRGQNRFLFLEDGYRIPGDDSSWVGRGWFAVDVNGKPVPRSGMAQDWLFRAETTAIPLPTTAALACVGLGFVAQRRRRS